MKIKEIKLNKKGVSYKTPNKEKIKALKIKYINKLGRLDRRKESVLDDLQWFKDIRQGTRDYKTITRRFWAPILQIILYGVIHRTKLYERNIKRLLKRLNRKIVNYDLKLQQIHQELCGSYVRYCAICNCEDLRACEGGCYWVEENLCSSCVGKL